MQHQKVSLPIDSYLEAIRNRVLESSTILIKASPGSGKTTRLPWFIAKSTPNKVIVLEPRRLAAKLAAERIAFEEGFQVGKEVGYHFRFEKKVSPETKLLFYTEGTFLKRLLSDPDLSDTDIVIIDEFHERHLETDMAYAYLDALRKRRPELKLILMSATLDTHLIQDAAIVEIEAPHYPVDIHYLPNQPSILNQTIEQKIRGALQKARPEGDVLIFLPGMREILKVKDYLNDRYGEVHILHSEVPKEEQEEALKRKDHRKIILSTNIAESSITIPGIEVVIDSGIQREAHYSPWNGLKFITDRPVTKASAIQRAGRAGRTAPGECHRLYSLQDFEARPAFTLPEITRADLTDAYLLSSELKSELLWPTPPPQERWSKARELCYLMGIIDANGAVTSIGKRTHHYPVDLRLSRILIAGEKLPSQEKKKLLRYICREIENDSSGILERRLSFYTESGGSENFPWEKCLLSGFIDQVARYRPSQNDFIHFSGKTIKLHSGLGSLTEGYYLILDITQRQEAIRIIEIEEEWLFDHTPFPFTEENQISVDDTFALKVLTKLGSIVIDEQSSTSLWDQLTPSQKSKVLELGKRPFEKRWEAWKESSDYNRYHFYSKIKNIKFEEIESHITLSDYLQYTGNLSWKELEHYFLHTLNDKLQVNDLDRLLPKTIDLGGRRELIVHYPYKLDPYVEAHIQDFYGVKETPRIGKENIPLTIKLLGPHKRPVQVTKDLPGFWQRMYQETKKEWQREYPRHYWPDDPTTARPVLLKSRL